MKINLYGLLLTLIILGCSSPPDHWEITSPNHHIRISVELKEGNLWYQAGLMVDGQYQTVINPSPLGLTTNQSDLSKDLHWVSGEEITVIDEHYTMLSGKRKDYHNHAKELALEFTNAQDAPLTIRFRAYDDGMAFRYELGGKPSGEVTVQSEATGFSIPLEARSWLPNYDTASGTTPAYETLYTNGSPAGEDAPMSPGWSFPMLFETDYTWLLVSEANVYNYPGVHLDSVVTEGTYKVRFPEPDEHYQEGPAQPSSTLPWNMPWRFIIIGEDMNSIVKSGLVYHLSDPNKVEDTGWIIPGRASWSWWSSTGRGRQMNRLKDFTDLAVEMDWEYTLVDAGWQNIEGGTIEALIDYATDKNIGVLLWYNSGGRRGRNQDAGTTAIMEDRKLRRQEMKRIHEQGVKGIKIDFFNSDKPHIMKQYQDILEDAAEYQLLVNFHGCTLPRGWTRTYPHLLTMEAIKGGENYRYDRNFPDNAPWINTIAFLSRNTVGPMDYTPVMFGDQRYPHKTTYAHELATAVLFESGITHFADRAESYRSMSEEVKTFLSNIPVTWDELEVLDAYPGSHAVAVRKSDDGVWYLAGINGESEERGLSLSLDFLDGGSAYGGNMFIDGDTASILNVWQGIDAESAFQVDMLPYGGFVCVITPIPDS